MTNSSLPSSASNQWSSIVEKLLSKVTSAIYIKSDINSIGSYITENFTKSSSTTTVLGISYYKYTKK